MDLSSSILKENKEVFGAKLVASQLHMVPSPSKTAYSRVCSAPLFSKEENQGAWAMMMKSALKSPIFAWDLHINIMG